MPGNTKSPGGLKAQLRKKLREERAAQSPELYERNCAIIRDQVLILEQVVQATSVYSYLAFQGEVQTQPIIRSMLDAGKRVYAPGPDHAANPAESIHHVVSEGDAFRLKPIDPTQLPAIDVFLVPGIAWDRRGNRVGFGGGYFDRLLAANSRAYKIGLAFDFQIVDLVPLDPWDIPMDLIVTESGILTCDSLRPS